MQNVVIVGALSTIARATARIYAERGDNLLLAARDEERLKAEADDLKVRGAADAIPFVMDATDEEAQDRLMAKAFKGMGGIDILLIAHGTLPDQRLCETDDGEALKALNVNALSPVMIATKAARGMEKAGSGTIAVISSVAGDRGRQSNYVYGAAKGMVSLFFQGLRNRLVKSGVHVLTIKPGFVDTAMTADIEKGALWAKPEKVAGDIVKAIDNGKDVLYTPWFWRPIMGTIRTIPERVFKKMSM